jgi:hypothetical protein
MVLALSAADIPVVTPPPLKSTETVNAVSMGSVLLLTMTCNPNFYSGFQLTGHNPRPWVAMKLIISELLFGCCQNHLRFLDLHHQQLWLFFLDGCLQLLLRSLSCILFVIMVAIYFLDGNNFWNNFGTDLKSHPCLLILCHLLRDRLTI